MAEPSPSDSSPLRGSAGVPVPLSDLRAGDRGQLYSTDLVREDRNVLSALGFALESVFRVCKIGDPFIVKVRGTRIGLSPALARHLLVIPEERPRR